VAVGAEYAANYLAAEHAECRMQSTVIVILFRFLIGSIFLFLADGLKCWTLEVRAKYQVILILF